MSKKLVGAVFLVLALRASSAFAQNEALQGVIHEMKDVSNLDPKNEYWDVVRRSLAGYSPEEIVRALLVEVDVDRGNLLANDSRDFIASELIRTLGLPPTLVCQELEKEQTPSRKASLIVMLAWFQGARGNTSLAASAQGSPTGGKTRPYGGRIC